MTLRRLLALVIALTCVYAPPVAAQVEPESEAWFEFKALPGLSTTPDWNTAIYQSYYSVGPGHETYLRGRAPAARYWSFAILDQANREITNLSDFEIETQADGSYEVVVRLGCGEPQNCLDTSDGTAPSAAGRILYRIYVPDTDSTGGVPLPQVGYRPVEDDSVVGLPGTEVDLPTTGEAWRQLNDSLINPLRPGGPVHETLGGPTGREGSVAPGSTGPAPEARRYDGLGGQQVETLEAAGAPPEVITAIQDARGRGGLGATADNAYVTMEYGMRSGNLVVRALAPSYRSQHPDAANALGRADGTEQVRYWSLCTAQSTRSIDCVRDEQVPLDDQGYFVAIVAPACPVSGYAVCLRAGATTSNRPGSLIYRNLLAAPAFSNDAGPKVCPAGESQFCGDHALIGQYVPRP